MEKRFKLTQVQFESLVETQITLQQHITELQRVQVVFEAAQEDLTKIKKQQELVIGLILDAYNLPVNIQAELDPATKELIVNVESEIPDFLKETE